MTRSRRLITGGHILSMDPSIGEIPYGDLLIEGTKIAEVDRRIEASDCEVVDADGMIVMPGFFDAHRHTWQTALRGLGADFTVQEYRSCLKSGVGPHMRPEDVYTATLAGALEALDAGVTTMVDWAHIMNTPAHADASIDALESAGLRAVFAYGTPSDHETERWHMNSALTHPDNIRRVRRERLADDEALVTLALGARAPYMLQRSVMVHDWNLARDLGVRITADGLGGGTWSGVPWGPDGRQPIDALRRAGLLGPDTTYIHCNNLGDDELRLIRDSGGSVVMAPDSEMHVGHTFPVMRQAVELGLRPALSIDIVCQVPGDMFSAMRSVLAADRGVEGARHYARREGPESWSITTKDVMEFATLSGARAAGMDHRVGTLAVGKEADLILVDTRRLNLQPLNNAIGMIALQAHPGNVDSVFVAGKALKRHGDLIRGDLSQVRDRLSASRDYLFARAGLETGWGFRGDRDPQWAW